MLGLPYATGSAEKHLPRAAAIGRGGGGQPLPPQPLGLPTLAPLSLINEELWMTARKGVNVILTGPEQLKSDAFEMSLRDTKFHDRMCGTGFDEVHLLNTWHPQFRKDFLQMGLLKARLTERHSPWVLTTATLRDGPPYTNILDLLGLTPGRFHLIRRSNLRPDVQILFRQLHSSLDSGVYPELDWILDSRRSTIIFAKHISLGSKVYTYLSRKCHPQDRDRRIRLYNSMNFESHNAATRELLEHPDTSSDGCQIVIGTDSLSVSINIPVRQDAIIIGDVDDADEVVQKGGRVGRNRELVSDAQVIVYITSAAKAAAEKALKTRDLPLPPKTNPPDLSMAEMIIASCKVELSSSRSACNCSGCVPESLTPPAKPAAAVKAIDLIPKHKRLSKLQRTHGEARLHAFQRDIWRQADVVATSFLPPEAFLPSILIKQILDLYDTLISSADALVKLVSTHRRLHGHHDALFRLLVELKPEFQKIAKDRKVELAAAKAGIKKKSQHESDEEGSSEISSEEPDSDSEVESNTSLYQSRLSRNCCRMRT
ncbi:hypothetical protein B0H14DRAFT_3701947 [Mycena olivaceomarginata]|nr:hypothetical protein B0H14DRAFT_3701947 [Mycena olivaceomarginata]